jgi:Family of unknown function (DUF6804)
MLTMFMKVASAISLLLMALWVAPPGVKTMMGLLVSVGALAVATQAAGSSKYIWATGFVVISVLFNPVAPVVLSRGMFFWLDLACVLVFTLSLETLKGLPGLSIPSHAPRKPGV